MKRLLAIENLTIKKNNQELIKNMSLNIFDGVSCFLCGTSGSGKSVLLEAINGSIDYDGIITCDSKVTVLFDHLHFNSNTIEDEIRYLSLDANQKEFVNNFFDLDKLKMNPNNLSFKEQKLLILCSFLWQNPQLLFIDNLFSYLSKSVIKKFTTYFKKNKITIVLASTNIEEALNYKYMIVLDQGIIAIEGKTEQVLKEEKLLKRLGIGLPFYVDLSIQLKCYNLIDKIYLNKKELVDKLWK